MQDFIKSIESCFKCLCYFHIIDGYFLFPLSSTVYASMVFFIFTIEYAFLQCFDYPLLAARKCVKII